MKRHPGAKRRHRGTSGAAPVPSRAPGETDRIRFLRHLASVFRWFPAPASAGFAAFQAECRGFESRLPLLKTKPGLRVVFWPEKQARSRLTVRKAARKLLRHLRARRRSGSLWLARGACAWWETGHHEPVQAPRRSTRRGGAAFRRARGGVAEHRPREGERA